MKHPFLHYVEARDTWYIFYYDSAGKRHKSSTGKRTRNEAKESLRLFVPPVVTDQTSIRLSEFYVELIAYARGKYTDRTIRYFELTMRGLITLTRYARIKDVTVKDAQLYLEIVRRRASDWTERIHYTTLASVFERAKDWGIVESNVWRSIKKPKGGERNILFFTREKFDSFVSGIKMRHYQQLYTFAVHTGMRLGEICAAKWEHVDEEKNCIRVINGPVFQTKTKRSRVIPISGTLRSLLAELPRDGEYIFGDKPNTVSTMFRHFLKRMPEQDHRLHFHSLRHTFASWLVQGHVPLYEVQKLLGHTTIATTEIYAHLLDDTLQESIRVLDK